MKKTVTILTAMLVCVTVFFCVPVSAATYTGSPAVHKTASGSGSGVTYEINLDQYYPEQNADSGLAAGEVYTQVYYRITNSNDSAAYVRNTGFTIQWVTSPYIVTYQTVSSNLLLGYQNTSGSWYIYGDAPYSYSSGIVVPPHASLYMVGYIVTSASVSGNAISSQAISSVSLASHTITLGDYPYGNESQTLDQIETLIADIKAQLTFTGSITPVADATVVQRSFQFADMGATLPTGVSGYISLKRLSGFAASEAVATALGSYAYQSVTYVRPYLVNVFVNNNTDHAIKSNLPYLNFQNLFDKLAKPSIISYGLDSSLIGTPNIVMDSGDFLTLQLPIKYSYDGNTYIPKGNHVVTFYLLFVFEQVNTSYAYNTNATMNNVFSTSDVDISYNTESAIAGINSDLHQLLVAYNSVNGTGDLSSDSNTLTEGLNNAHQAEQNYFADNSQALAASGISNPNFEASDRTGINSAITGNKNQFGMLWNAIGAWRNVYIYAALMCLVTYLLRHRPWIRSGSGNYEGILHDRNGGK